MVGINQDFGRPTEAPSHAQTDKRAPKTVYDLPPGSPPYSTTDAHGNVTNHKAKPQAQGGHEDNQTPGMDRGRVDAQTLKQNRETVTKIKDLNSRQSPAPETGVDELVKNFVRETFEDEDTGRLEAGRAIASARSVAGRGQGSASGGMLAHAADVSMSAADRAQEKMFGRKLAVSGVAANLSRADLELSKMDENTRRNALAAIIMGASGGMDPDQVQALVDAYENGDAQAQSIIADLWPKDGDEGKPDAVDDEEDGDSILTAPLEEQQSLWDQITGKKKKEEDRRRT